MNIGCIQDCKGCRKYFPGKLLSPYINSFQVFSGGFEFYRVIDLYPDGGIGLIVNLGESVTINEKVLGKGVYFDGANSRNVSLCIDGKVNLIRIRFNPGMFYLFFKMNLSNYHNVLDNLCFTNNIFPRNFFKFLEFCDSDIQKITAVETWLTYNLSDPDNNILLVLSILKHINSNQYDIKLQALAEDMGVEIRRLQRLFRKVVGMTPKKLVKLLRADNARRMLDANDSLSCLDITYRCGYYDQAHFNREFKGFYEITPSEYRKRAVEKRSNYIA
ncbi:helix-turn-helix domain-containing protein [Microbulbifer litoralis]|uniref:helix-turn-helix domain-containing protein n=1 Tax=Microbulbifer litoralis TaxID=2933965 RepID=UPI0020285212|nr:helix-turn-helix domain-containing protein [Microbulbifer sp. GX H0434]